jgi:hypothetical protein
MPTNYNFQEIWNQKNIEVPDIKEIKAKAEKYRKRQLLKDIGLIALLLFITIIVIAIWIFVKFTFFTTKWGIVFMLIGLVSYTYLVYQNVTILKKVNTSASNQEYLLTMKKTEQQQIYMQTRGLSFYYLSLSLGFTIYFYELTLKMSWLGVAAVYGLTFLWCAISWFIIRPRQIRKQKEKISLVINSLEKLEESLDE